VKSNIWSVGIISGLYLKECLLRKALSTFYKVQIWDVAANQKANHREKAKSLNYLLHTLTPPSKKNSSNRIFSKYKKGLLKSVNCSAKRFLKLRAISALPSKPC
jgi:hypothetical protein